LFDCDNSFCFLVQMAVIPSPTTYINARLLDGNKERLNTLTPLRGYARQPYLSIKEAAKPLHELVDDIDSRVWTVTNRCKDASDILTHDESAAIMLYTIEWDLGHPSIYSILNETLRLEDRDRLVPWFPYLKLLLSGLFKLPSVQYTIWRGVTGDLSSNYKIGEFYTWWAFSSCTTLISVLANNYRYLGGSSPCTLFAIECLNGKNIKRHSYFAHEDEVLLLPCTYFQVIDNLSRRDGLNIIHLREEPPLHMLLEPPFPISSGKKGTKHH
jgi:hypothetical protein